MAIQLLSSVVRQKGLMSAEIDNDIVILGLVSNNYIALDEIGRNIWDLLEKPHKVDEICNLLSEKYAGDPLQIQKDTLRFLTELEKEGLVCVE
jgi:hypothetical protein